MAWTTPRTWVPGELVTASMMNIHVRDNLNFLLTTFGVWTPASFNAGDYTATGGGWTVTGGMVLQNRYSVMNKILFWNVMVQNSTVTSTPTQLLIAVPGGVLFYTTVNYNRVARLVDNAVVSEGTVTPASAGQVAISRSSGSATFAASTTATTVQFSAWFELT